MTVGISDENLKAVYKEWKFRKRLLDEEKERSQRNLKITHWIFGILSCFVAYDFGYSNLVPKTEVFVLFVVVCYVIALKFFSVDDQYIAEEQQARHAKERIAFARETLSRYGIDVNLPPRKDTNAYPLNERPWEDPQSAEQ